MKTSALDECRERAGDFRVERSGDTLVATWSFGEDRFIVGEPRIIEATEPEWREAVARRALFEMITKGPVWQETWDSDAEGLVVAGDGMTETHGSRFNWEQQTNLGAFGDVGDGVPIETNERDVARAELAAQAPAMARLLLVLRERDGVDSDDMARIDALLEKAGVRTCSCAIERKMSGEPTGRRAWREGCLAHPRRTS